MNKKLYHVSLCWYDENNMPVGDYEFFVRSKIEPNEIELKKDYRVQELMEENDDEGISLIMEVNEDELEEYENPDVFDLD